MLIKLNTAKKIYKLLQECIDFDNIENAEFILKNINSIKGYQKQLSRDIYSQIDKFIGETIKPIIYDVDYFSFIKRKEFGSYDNKGHFVINSEDSLEKMIFLLYEHTLELNEKLNQFASKHLCQTLN